MKAKSKRVVGLSLCGALVLGGIACAIGSAFEAKRHREEKVDLLEKYEYDLNNAKLKSEKILELTQKFENKEISYETFQYEINNLEDVPEDVFMQEYATKEDANKFENTREGYLTAISLSYAGIGAFAFGGLIGVKVLSKEKDPDENKESSILTK